MSNQLLTIIINITDFVDIKQFEIVRVHIYFFQRQFFAHKLINYKASRAEYLIFLVYNFGSGELHLRCFLIIIFPPQIHVYFL